jgi:hypothetical protein
VNHFIAANPENRSAQNLCRFRVDADLDETLCLAFFVGPAYLAHGIFRSEGAPSGFSYLCVCHAASPERRIDVERVGWNPV